MATAHIEMHGEHQQWLSDQAMWRDDVGVWLKEIDQAFDSVRELEDALREHRKVLREHGHSLAPEERMVSAHEHALAEFEKGGPGDELIQMATTHKATSIEHGQRRKAHERLKKRHHTVMAYWNLLRDALAQKK